MSSTKQSSGTALLDGHTDGVSAVAFSPDGALLASASRDGSVQLWDAQNASLITSVRLGTSVPALALDGCNIAVALDRRVACLLIKPA